MVVERVSLKNCQATRLAGNHKWPRAGRGNRRTPSNLFSGRAKICGVLLAGKILVKCIFDMVVGSPSFW